MVSLDRWQRAQKYERDYWESQASGIAAGAVTQLDWYRWRADQLVARLRGLGLGALTEGQARVLEVGSGPVGVVGFFPARERVAVDPLEPSYARNPVLTELRSATVEYRAGSVEALPVESARYDLVIIENCIDHVRDITAGMRELKRVLVGNGVLYLTVNCRSPWGFVVHRALSRLRVDAGHPHTFTPPRARKLLGDHGFRELQCDTASYRDARNADLASPERSANIKAWLGISEFLATVVAQNDLAVRRATGPALATVPS